MKRHEEDYIKSCVDVESVVGEAEKIYKRRLRSSRHYEYSPVFVKCGTLGGKDLLEEVSDRITGFMFR